MRIGKEMISNFHYNGQTYWLKDSVTCEVDRVKSKGETLWIYHVATFQIWGLGKTRYEAEETLGESFHVQIDDLLDESDDNLTLDAIRLRDRLRDCLVAGTIK